MEAQELRKTIRELLSPRRLIVTMGVAGAMGMAEWFGIGHPVGLAFGLAMGVAVVTLAPLPWLLILPWGIKYNPLQLAWRSFAVLGLSAVVVLLGFAGYAAMRHAFAPIPRPLFPGAWAVLSDWTSEFVSIPLYAAAGWGLARHLQLERRLELHDAREVALRNALDEARMLAMRSRLDPHFLFNALNLVAELCREDAAEAERCVLRLSGLLRAALDQADRPTIALGRELDLCADYLELCRTRFGDRLKVHLLRAPECEGAQVPSFAVQVLVENAVRHGVERRAQGGCVEVTVSALPEGFVRVQVANPGQFLGERTGGVGLELTRKRIALAYQGRASLDVGNSPEGDRTLATLVFPKVA